MDNLPSGDIQAKYQKLASEYSKLRVHVKVLKKGVLDEQAKSTELREALKEKEKSLRKGELEIDSLSFRNQQLTRRVSVLQDELELLQVKSTKKSKGKVEDRHAGSSQAPLDSGLLQEELQKRIFENAQLASQLSDRVFEISQLQATLEDYQKTIFESDSKHKSEVAKLKHKNHELQFSLEDVLKEKVGGTPSKVTLPSSSKAPSCNGDFLSEGGGSWIGSEDALSCGEPASEQLSTRVQALDQDNQKLKMEYELLRLENDSLKLDLAKYISASQKRRGDTHDSGDFNVFSETSIDGEGRVTGLLGSLEVPFVLSEEVQMREERMKIYFRNVITDLTAGKERGDSKCEHYIRECEILRLRFEGMQQEKEADDATIQDKHRTISRLEEELHSTSRNYEEQMSVLTEHVAALLDQLAAQHDAVDRLQAQLGSRRK